MRTHRTTVTLTLVLALLVTIVPIQELLAQPQATPITEAPAEVPATPEPTLTPTEPSTLPTAEISAGTPEIGPATPSPDATSTLNAPLQVADGSMRNCSQSSLEIPPGGTVSITCDLTIGVVLLGTPIAQITRPALPGGFTASINMVHDTRSESMPAGSSQAVLRMPLGLTLVGGTRTARVTILINAPVGATVGARDPIRFNTCRGAATGGCLNQPGSVEVRLSVSEVTLVDGDHYTANCTPANANQGAIGFGEHASFDCHVSASESLGDTRLVLNDLVTTLNGASGWAGELVNAQGDVTGTVPGVYHLQQPYTILAGESFEWEIRLFPTACSAGDAPLTLGIRGNITPVDSSGGNPGPTITTSPRTIGAEFESPPPGSATAILTSEPVTDPVAYSMTDEQSRSASVTAQYTVEGCDPWDGYIAMTPFASTSDEAYSGPVPELESASRGDTSQEGDGFTHVSRTQITTIDATPTQVIAGTEPGIEVVVEHTINLVYTIPANTPVGTYSSTITVTISDAP